jgi:hypothetical protein
MACPSLPSRLIDIDKNLLGDRLNILKWKLNVKFKNTLDDYQLKTSMLRLNAGFLITGRKFAEHRGLEDAERIDSDPFILFQQKE